MKNNTERDAIIFRMWCNGCTYEQIAAMKIQSFLSLKRIRNIIYAGRNKTKSDNEREIYRIFRLKFLEVQDVNSAIMYTWTNQPSHTLHIRHIRKIINAQLKQQKELISPLP